METTHVKVQFDLEPDDTRYPPASAERLWAIPVGVDRYKIDSIPFFVRGLSCDDEVIAQPDESLILRFVGFAQGGGHSTFRVVLYDIPSQSNTLEERTQKLRRELRELGCRSEQSHVRGLISVDVPPSADFANVRTFLQRGEEHDLWGYEEAAIAQPYVM
jgi:hypothetical protein